MDDNFLQAISDAVKTDNTTWLLSQAVVELHRIANAQEAVVALAQTDLEAQVAAEVETRSQARAEELVVEKTSRSYIGKR